MAPPVRRAALAAAFVFSSLVVLASPPSSFTARPQEGPAAPPAQSEELRRFSFDSESVLGTSMHLELAAPAPALKPARVALMDEIERLEKILSTYSSRSELRKLPRPCAATPASKELREVLHAAERWMRDSGGTFHPGVQVLSELWKAAEQRGSAPTPEELAAAKARLVPQLWTIDDASGTVALLTDLPLTFDAFAKGYILDAAVTAAVNAGARDVVLDIGGDVRVHGDGRARIAVADPRQPADNADKLCELDLRGLAVATSGGYARGFDIAGQHFSHIFDPRTAAPVTAVLQATVVAPDAATADALATILNVLAPREGLALVANVPGAASLVIDAQGQQHASPEWAQHVRKTAPVVASGPSVLPGGGQLVLSFELQQPPPEAAREGGDEGRGGRGGRERRGGGGYRRPYVAAWVEDAQGHAVRTLALWVAEPKWIPDLRRWNRLYSRREDDVRAVTRATRAAGKYELVWDGRDDTGQPVEAGTFTVNLEVVREHGTYQLLTAAFVADGRESSIALKGDGIEVKAATLAYRLAKKP